MSNFHLTSLGLCLLSYGSSTPFSMLLCAMEVKALQTTFLLWQGSLQTGHTKGRREGQRRAKGPAPFWLLPVPASSPATNLHPGSSICSSSSWFVPRFSPFYQNQPFCTPLQDNHTGQPPPTLQNPLSELSTIHSSQRPRFSEVWVPTPYIPLSSGVWTAPPSRYVLISGSSSLCPSNTGQRLQLLSLSCDICSASPFYIPFVAITSVVPIYMIGHYYYRIFALLCKKMERKNSMSISCYSCLLSVSPN